MHAARSSRPSSPAKVEAARAAIAAIVLSVKIIGFKQTLGGLGRRDSPRRLEAADMLLNNKLYAANWRKGNYFILEMISPHPRLARHVASA
jgi:hypothetical protein